MAFSPAFPSVMFLPVQVEPCFSPGLETTLITDEFFTFPAHLFEMPSQVLISRKGHVALVADVFGGVLMLGQVLKVFPHSGELLDAFFTVFVTVESFYDVPFEVRQERCRDSKAEFAHWTVQSQSPFGLVC